MSHDHDERERHDERARQVKILGRSRILAEESYARFQVNYEAEHGLKLAEWAALDEGTQARWREMLAPLAQQLVQAEENEHVARLHEEEHRELRTRADRDAARLVELEDLVARVSQRLPEAALLAKLPAPLLEALASLSSTAAPVVRAEPPAIDAAGAERPEPALVGAGPSATAGDHQPALSDSLGALPASTASQERPEQVEAHTEAWGRVEQVEARIAAAGLADLDAFTDAQLGQVGGIVAEVLGLNVNPAALVTLGNVSVAFTRAFASVRKTTG